MADTNNTDRAQWKFNALYADTEVRSVADDKLLAVVHAGSEQARIVSLLKGASQPNAALADGWMPVEDAPRGQLMLFCDMNAKELRSSFFVDWMVGGEFCGNRHHKATHCMPLPPAPPTLNASKGLAHG